MRHALILDTETTGLDPALDRCIEVACILFDLEHAIPIASYASLIRAESNAAESVNRIPAGTLPSAPEPAQVWRAVSYFAARADVILAHRAEFDRGFVPTEVRELKPWVCTKFHVEWPHGKPGDHLVHLALAHGLGVLNAHRAMTDCDTIARLLTRVREMGHSLRTILERASRPRVKLAALVSYDDREKAKAAGFSWDGAAKRWWREMPVEDVASLPFQTTAIQD